MKERLHIAHFTNTYHPVISGVVRSVSDFRKALTRLGHNVFIVAQSDSEYNDREPFVFRYPAIDLPVANDFPLAFPISNFIDRVLPILKLDVIHSHHPFLIGQAATRKAEELDVPLVFTHHTRYKEYSHYLGLSQDLFRKTIERWVGDYMKHCQHVIVPSESIRQMLLDTYGLRDRVTVLPTGIDTTPFKEADGQRMRRRLGWGDDIVHISVGRLSAEKNWPVLIKAFAKVAEEYPSARLVLLGDGDERQKLEKLCRELGVQKRVDFAGLVPFEEVPAYLKAADIFCFASTSETQGLVTMEAMAAGLPVVAVDATGTSDVVKDGVDGILTENEPAALAAGLRQVLQDEVRRDDLSKAALKKADAFTIAHQAAELVKVYQQAIEDKRRRRNVLMDELKPIFSINWQEWFRRKDDESPRPAT